MELLYLWIEDYKNIKKQGFNFSPQFKCEFKDEYDENGKLKDNCELIIDENENHVNIFSENINITAIVGENGSGKSSLIEIIFKILFQDEFRKNRIEYSLETYILVFKTSLKNKIYTNNKSLIKKYSIIEKKELLNTYYLLIDFSLGQNPIYNSKENYKKNYSLEPSRISMTASSGEFLGKIESNAFNNNMKVNAVFFYFFIKKNKLEKILEELQLPDLDILNFLKPSSYSGKNKKEKFEEFKQNNLIFFNYNFKEIRTYEDLIKRLGEDFRNIKIDALSIEDIKEFEKMFYFMSIEIKSNTELFFENFSTGQKLLISYFGIIARSILFRENKTSFFIVIDEIENSLHANWQKRIIKYLDIFLNAISKLSKETNEYKLLFLTHSPFLLSDLPKENVIFLEKDEKTGNCINATNKVDINPFGANIHTLLSHGFFMKKGLMGEFAKDKIKSIIDYHEELSKKELTKKENKIQRDEEKEIYEKEHKTKFWQIQSIIGDDYLKQVIKNHLVEIEKIVLENDEAKEEEIKRLEAKIELLRKQNAKS